MKKQNQQNQKSMVKWLYGYMVSNSHSTIQPFNHFLITVIFSLITVISFSQNIAVNTTGAAANASAILDISATNLGLLIPRVVLTSTTDGTTITSPATSLLVYSQGGSLSDGYYYNSGTPVSPNWSKLISTASPASCCSNWTLVAVANSTFAGTGIFSSGYTAQANKEYLAVCRNDGAVDFTLNTSDNVFLSEGSKLDVPTNTITYYSNFFSPTWIFNTDRIYFCGRTLNGSAVNYFEYESNNPGAAYVQIYGNGLIQIRDPWATYDMGCYIFER